MNPDNIKTPNQKIPIFRRELEQLQNEKRKALVEHETTKLKEIDERLQHELRDWKAQLIRRKQVNM